MGNVLKELGELDEAHTAYLRGAPARSDYRRRLRQSCRFKEIRARRSASRRHGSARGEDRRTCRRPIACSSISRLGKAYADLKDYDRSFEHLLAGNAAKRATIAYDEQATFALFDRIEAVFTRDLIAAKSGGGDPSPLPIFVIGMPRSGTTLVEQIIASHPAGAMAPANCKTFNDVVLTVRGPDGNTIALSRIRSGARRSAAASRSARAISRWSARSLPSTDARTRSAITDKMPSNYYFAGLIHLALPNAKIIHTIRDPVDTCISCFSKLFAGRAEPHLRSRRAWPLLQTIRAA